MSLYFLYCVRYLVFCFLFVLSYLFGCYHFVMNKDIYIYYRQCPTAAYGLKYCAAIGQLFLRGSRDRRGVVETTYAMQTAKAEGNTRIKM